MAGLFGTDGIRGVANETPITVEMGLQLGRAVVAYCEKYGREPQIILGRDTRISGAMLEHALISGILSQGGSVICVGEVPTPAVAYLTRVWKGGAGLVVSASHNPYEYNGFKVFSHEGFKLSQKEEEDIEALIESGVVPFSGKEMGPAEYRPEGWQEYNLFLNKILTSEDSLGKLKIVLDCANGATYKAAPALFSRHCAHTEVLFADPDGRNINHHCGSQFTEELQKKVVALKADVGLAFDGDGDRLIAVDEKGTVLKGDQILAICAKMLKEKGTLKNDLVVSTVMSNMGLTVALDGFGVDQEVTPVGDRHVVEAMRSQGAVLGGEDSGHVIFLEHHTTGDGILSALQLLSSMTYFREPLSKLAGLMTVFPQILMNVPVKSKPDLETLPEVKERIEAVERDLGDMGRVLVRYSGTEPLCRVMVEGRDQNEVGAHAREIAKVIGQNLS
jgi:phosphoglucosamine mutase